MSTCSATENRAFYNTKNFAFGDFVEHPIAPTTDGKAARCWGPGFNSFMGDKDCPAGWSFVSETSSGCSDGRRRPLCKFNAYPTDNRSRARCCLGLHTEGQMSAAGAFPANGKPCPPNFCVSKQSGIECRLAVEEYCATQMGPNAPDNRACWRYAKQHLPDTIDKYCRNAGSGNGLAIETDKNCREYANSNEAYGNLDDAMLAYCNSAAGFEKPLCSCYPAARKLSENDKELSDLGSTLACWSEPCIKNGYKSSSDADRLAKGCGDFCAQVTQLKDVTISAGFNAQQACTPERDTAVKTIGKELQEKIANKPPPLSPFPSWLFWVWGGIAVAILLALVSYVLISIFGGKDQDDSEAVDDAVTAPQQKSMQPIMVPPNQPTNLVGRISSNIPEQLVATTPSGQSLMEPRAITVVPPYKNVP